MNMLDKETFKFLKDLESNNNRNWFLQNKPRYVKYIKEPIESICDNLKSTFGTAHIFRPNRDLRFSKIKIPYKTQASFEIKVGASGFYFQVSKDSILIGAGIWGTEKDQLLNFRNIFSTESKKILDANTKTAESIKSYLVKMEKLGFEISKEDSLKTAPRGFDKNSPDIIMLRLRHLAILKEYKIDKIKDWVCTAELLKVIKKDFNNLKEWNDILNKNVGATKIIMKPRVRENLTH